MHKAAWDFVESVKAKHPGHFKNKRVLEVGSRYINGTVRTLFEGCDYMGLDLSPGPLVDAVCHVADMPTPDVYYGEPEPYGPDQFDTIISCEALEHDKRWQESVSTMWELLSPGGLLIITAGGTGRPEHGTTRTNPTDSPATTDYYGNITEPVFWAAFGRQGKMTLLEHRIEDKDGDFRFWGKKA